MVLRIMRVGGYDVFFRKIVPISGNQLKRILILKKIVSGPGQGYSTSQSAPVQGSGNLQIISGSGNSSDEVKTSSVKRDWASSTGIPHFETQEGDRELQGEGDLGSGSGNRRFISPEKKTGGGLLLGNSIRGSPSFSTNSGGGAIGAWPSNEMTVKVTPMEVIIIFDLTAVPTPIQKSQILEKKIEFLEVQVF